MCYASNFDGARRVEETNVGTHLLYSVRCVGVRAPNIRIRQSEPTSSTSRKSPELEVLLSKSVQAFSFGRRLEINCRAPALHLYNCSMLRLCCRKRFLPVRVTLIVVNVGTDIPGDVARPKVKLVHSL